MSEKTGEKLENVAWGKPGYQSDKKTPLKEPDTLNAALRIFSSLRNELNLQLLPSLLSVTTALFLLEGTSSTV